MTRFARHRAARYAPLLSLLLCVGCAVDDAGEPCGSASECEGECFSNQFFSDDGICTSRCGGDAFAPCPADFACVDIATDDFWCLPECEGFFGDSCSDRFGEAWQCESLPLASGGDDETVCID